MAPLYIFVRSVHDFQKKTSERARKRLHFTIWPLGLMPSGGRSCVLFLFSFFCFYTVRSFSLLFWHSFCSFSPRIVLFFPFVVFIHFSFEGQPVCAQNIKPIDPS